MMSIYAQDHHKQYKNAGCQLISIGVLESFHRPSTGIHRTQSIKITIINGIWYGQDSKSINKARCE